MHKFHTYVPYLVRYDTLLQNAIDVSKNYDSYFIVKCDKNLLQMRQRLLITKCESFLIKYDITSLQNLIILLKVASVQMLLNKVFMCLKKL